MMGKVPGLPKFMSGVIDVRTLAEAHLLAMEKEGISGHRFIIS